jgi:hypothetical protein
MGYHIDNIFYVVYIFIINIYKQANSNSNLVNFKYKLAQYPHIYYAKSPPISNYTSFLTAIYYQQ